MKDDTPFYYGLMAGSIITLIIAIIIHSCLIGSLRRDAIAAGVAHYEVVKDKDGYTTYQTKFVWKKIDNGEKK